MINLKNYIIESIFDIEDNIDNVDESIREEIKHFLKDNFKTNSTYQISKKPNNDGKFEVSSNGDVEVKNQQITSLTNGSFIWTNINGNFSCDFCNSLTSLKGAPKEVGNSFYCTNCASIKSLEGAPKEVGGRFDCQYCKSLKSLEGAPKEVGGYFDCSYCKSLTSLEGAPKEIKCSFYCDYCNSLTSLEGAPEEVKGDFSCFNCKSLKSLEGAPEKVGEDFSCSGCDLAFTTNDVKKVSKVGGNIYV